MQNPQSSGVFECVIRLVVPAIDPPPQPGDVSHCSLEIAKFNFDPGLQVGEKVWVPDLKAGWINGESSFSESFNLEAMVTERRKEIFPRSQQEGSLFRLSIVLESAEKESVARITEIIRQLHRDVGNIP